MKCEPDQGGESHPFSGGDYHTNGIKEDENDPLLIRCPLMKTESEVSISVYLCHNTIKWPLSFVIG
jgi:hypothetical protein